MNDIQKHYLRVVLTPQKFKELDDEAKRINNTDKGRVAYILDNANLDNSKKHSIKKIYNAIPHSLEMTKEIGESLSKYQANEREIESEKALQKRIIPKIKKKVKTIIDDREKRISKRDADKKLSEYENLSAMRVSDPEKYEIESSKAKQRAMMKKYDERTKALEEKNKADKVLSEQGDADRLQMKNLTDDIEKTKSQMKTLRLPGARQIFKNARDAKKFYSLQRKRDELEKIKAYDPSLVDYSSVWKNLNPFMKSMYILNIPTQTLSWAGDRLIFGTDAHKWDGHSWSYVLEKSSGGNNKTISPAANIIGLAMDVVLDPLALIGMYAKVGKAGKALDIATGLQKWKVITKIDEIKNTTAIVRKLDNIIFAIKKAPVKYITKANKAEQVKTIEGLKKGVLKYKDKGDEFIRLAKKAEKKIPLEEKVEKGFHDIGKAIRKKVKQPGDKGYSKVKSFIHKKAKAIYKKFGADVEVKLIDTKGKGGTIDVAQEISKIAKADTAGTTLKYIPDLYRADTLQTIQQTADNLRDVSKHSTSHLQVILEKRAKTLAKNAGHPRKWKNYYKQLNAKIVDAIETDTVKKLPQADQHIANFFKRQMDKIAKYEGPAKGAPNVIANYVPHVDEHGRILSADKEKKLIRQIGFFEGGKRKSLATIAEVNSHAKKGQGMVNDLPKLLEIREGAVIRSHMNFVIQKKIISRDT